MSYEDDDEGPEIDDTNPVLDVVDDILDEETFPPSKYHNP